MLTNILQVQKVHVKQISVDSKEGYVSLLEDLEAQYWLHLEGNHVEWDDILYTVGMSDLERVLCNDERPFPRVEPLAHGLYLHFPVANSWEIEPYYVHLVMYKNMVLTYSPDKKGPLDRIFINMQNGLTPEGEEQIFLFLLILERLIENLVNNHLIARTLINTFIKSMKNEPEEDDNDSVMELKEKLGFITGQCEENLFSCTLLRTLLNKPLIPDLARHILNDILDTVSHVQKSLDRLDQRLEDQLLRIDSHLREQTDKRLRILTVLSSIFMPITFISGVFGMNFAYMPELQVSWGYYACLGGMAVIAMGMVVYFFIKGWFK